VTLGSGNAVFGAGGFNLYSLARASAFHCSRTV